MSVVTMRATLTDADIRTLVKGVTEDERAQAAHKLCRCIDDMELSDAERAHAREVLNIMAADAAVLVRRALAVALKNSPKLPRDVANKLAQDIDAIALPVIMNSPSLTDDDLVAIVCASPPSKQVAVASRPALSTTVTGAIAEHGAPAAIERALANDNAVFDATGYTTALDRFPEISSVTAAMAHRKVLPLGVTEKLVALVTGDVFDHLVNHHELPPQVAIDIALGARERATIDLIEQAALQEDIESFVRQINVHGRLTPSLLMRALCLGQMPFVEYALAELSGLAHTRIWLMMHDNGPLGLKAAFDRAGLPPRLFPPFRAAIDVYHQLERDESIANKSLFRVRMIERVLTLFQSIPREDLDYLLEKLNAAGEPLSQAAAR
ncbi:MAG: DUF2336 domain-containing protein [Alphaproteobacteria bacterium]|nr:DUF2336 domain-containing protein [Alphaproteobacteria bacterium]